MEQKEFEPSKRKLKKARQEGRVVHSSELATALILAFSFLFLLLIGGWLWSSIKNLFLHFEDPYLSLIACIYPLMILMTFIFFAALFSHLLQTGLLWSWPKRGKRQYRFFFPNLKLLGLLLLFFLFFKLLNIPQGDLAELLTYWLHKLMTLALLILLYLLLLGIIDYLYQRWRFYQEMRMTREEKKEEEKET